MIKNFKFFINFFFLSFLSFSPPSLANSGSSEWFTGTWVKESNEIAKAFIMELGALFPEEASGLGERFFDDQAPRVTNNLEEREKAFLIRWLDRLAFMEKITSDVDILVDIAALSHQLKRQLNNIELWEKYKVLPFYKASEVIYGHLRQLINPQADNVRKLASFTRFKKYVYGNEKGESLLKAHEKRLRYLIKKYGPHAFYPLQQEVESYLLISTQMVEGISELFEQIESTPAEKQEWQKDFEIFKKQMKEYDAFVRTILLPKARQNYLTAQELYVSALANHGIETPPEKLIEHAMGDFSHLLQAYHVLAHEIAEKNNLSEPTPEAVMNFLRGDIVTDPEKILKLYHQTNEKLRKIIIRYDLVTLPHKPLLIRLASVAESLSTPTSYVYIPPLFNNNGERPEIVLPNPAVPGVDLEDFFPAAALNLLAHEGRPGHDHHFNVMIERGVSVIRGLLAGLSTQYEGWALYAAQLVYPYLPLEAQFMALRYQLLRCARMFLDPQLNLGKITEAEALSVLTKEVGLSNATARSEINRYTYLQPGHAPSAYFGFLAILECKKKIQSSLAADFKEKTFNNKLLLLGALPISLIMEHLLEELTSNPQERNALPSL